MSDTKNLSKRETLIIEAKKKGDKIEFEDVLEGDRISLDNLKGKSDKSLFEVNKSIKSLLKNPDYNIDAELLSLYSQKQEHTNQLALIEKIREEYLTVE